MRDTSPYGDYDPRPPEEREPKNPRWLMLALLVSLVCWALVGAIVVALLVSLA